MSEMMINKYPVTLGEFSVTMPKASTVVAVPLLGPDLQPQMWVNIDPGSPAIARNFKVVTDGEHFEPSWRCIGPFMYGGYVFHLLEEPSNPADLADVLAALGDSAPPARHQGP